jgi:hypothetical protein
MTIRWSTDEVGPRRWCRVVDEPPDETPTHPPEPIVEEGPRSAGDLYRAEDAWGEGDTFTPSWGDTFLDPPPGRGIPKAFEEPHQDS